MKYTKVSSAHTPSPMCPLGFENEELYETMTDIITSHRDGKLNKINDIFHSAHTIHLFSTQLINRIMSEIPTLFNSNTTSEYCVVETPKIKTYLNHSPTTDYKKRLEWACEHLQKRFFSNNKLPFTMIRVIELAYHPFTYFKSHEFPKFVRSLEKCLYVTISLQQPKNMYSSMQQQQQKQQQQNISSKSKQIDSLENYVGQKRKRTDDESEESGENVKKQSLERENNIDEQERIGTPATPPRSITPSLQKIPWISPNQVQKAGPFLKELESIMAINFGYDEDDDDDDDDDDDEEVDEEEEQDEENDYEYENDNSQVSTTKKQHEKKFKSDSLEMKLKRDIKSNGDVIVEEYEEMEFDEDWSPSSQEDENSEEHTSSSSEEEEH